MKIGILTFDYCNNYGAVLQAYALRAYLESLGHDVSFGEYQLPKLLHRYDFIPCHVKDRSLIRRLKYYISCIRKYRPWKKKKKKFQNFRNIYLPTVSLQDESVNLWVVGSDQVWNPKITKCYDDIYYANGNLKQPYLFYAVSCPSNLLNKEILHNIKKRNYPVSVREAYMVEKLNAAGLASELVLDPTLLLSHKEWDRIVDRTNTEKKYIFSYNLSGIKQLPIVAKQISNKYGWEDISENLPLRDAGPIDFVNYFKNAEMTLVSSFHGVAFSIIFQRPFFFFPNHDERDERVFSLLKLLKLEECIFTNDSDISVPHIDWDIVGKELNILREKSKEFLINNIKRYDFH